MYPKGFRYFELDIKIRYNHKKELTIVKINRSDRNPKETIFIISIIEKEACVIGWKINMTRIKKLTIK
jgi:hypothetical protein